MNIINNLRNRILIDNGFYEKVLKSENDSYEDTELGPDGKYYKKLPAELSEDELNNFIKYKAFEFMKSMDAKLNTIKAIMIFWVVMIVVQFLLWLMIYGLFNKAFS